MAKGRRQRRSLVGVEIHDNEIRVVESRLASGKPVVIAAGSIHLPEKSTVDGEIVRIDAVAFALRRLLENLNIVSRDAILGVPFAGFTTRSLKLPPTPPDEQALLIEGEVKHFDVLRSADGAYDYFQIASKDPLEVGLVLMAAEGHITGSLRSLAERAGLDVVALEPISVGMLRTACTSVEGSPEGLLLLIGETATEAAVMHEGRYWLYRRIDIGSNALFQKTPIEMERIDPLSRPAEAITESAAFEAPALRKGPADGFAVEIRRTLEYFAREFPDATTKSVIRIVLNDPVAKPLQEFLADALGAEVRIVAPNGFVSQDAKVNNALSGETAFRYAGAYGLSLHHGEGIAETIPSLDLYVRERKMAVLESKRRTFAGSLVAAILAIVLAITGILYFGQKANHLENDLVGLKSEQASLRGSQLQSLQGSQQVIEQIAFFSRTGVPAVWFVDSIANSLNQEVGVNEIRFEDGGTVTITGEAASEQALLLTVQRIQTQPNLGMAYVSSFEKIDRNTANPAIRFQLRLVRGVPAPASPTGGSRS